MTAEERRESIIDAATHVFATAGYQRGKVSEIAARVGVTEPVVFQNFGSKAALFAIVLERAGVQMSAGLAQLAGDDDRPPIELLREFFSPHHQNRLHSRGSLGVLFQDAMMLTSEPEIAKAARRAIRAVAGAVAELFERAQRAGELRAGVDPDVAAWWLMSFIHSRAFRTAFAPDHDKLEANLAEMAFYAWGNT
jgi:AcrR family transcriptional regulator